MIKGLLVVHEPSTQEMRARDNPKKPDQIGEVSYGNGRRNHREFRVPGGAARIDADDGEHQHGDRRADAITRGCDVNGSGAGKNKDGTDPLGMEPGQLRASLDHFRAHDLQGQVNLLQQDGREGTSRRRNAMGKSNSFRAAYPQSARTMPQSMAAISSGVKDLNMSSRSAATVTTEAPPTKTAPAGEGLRGRVLSLFHFVYTIPRLTRGTRAKSE